MPVKELLLKKSVFFFVFVSLLIATYFILNLIIESTESNPGPPYAGAHGIKRQSKAHFIKDIFDLGKLQVYNALTMRR